MSEPVLFDGTFDALQRAMEISSKRQAVIAHNIANAKTPGYEAMTFDEQLMTAVKRLDNPQVVLEQELSSLTENSVKYSTYVKLMTSKIGVLRSIVTQGRR
jgi:flagellar basal body rod protein FlgB